MRHDKKPAIAELRAAIEPHCRSSSVVMISVNSDLDGVEWPLEKLFAGDHPVCWPRGIMEEDTIVSIDPGELALLYPESPGPMFVCVKAPVARSRIARDLGILTGH